MNLDEESFIAHKNRHTPGRRLISAHLSDKVDAAGSIVNKYLAVAARVTVKVVKLQQI